jgi:outer membrane protein
MKKNASSIMLALFGAITIYLLIDKFSGNSSKKVAVVQMEKLVYDFKGMKEATEKYTKKMISWKAETDTLEKKLRDMYDQVRIDSINKDQQKLNKDIQLFLMMKNSYLQYAQELQTRSEKEDKEMTIGVMNQLSEYIKNFSKEKGYDIVLTNSNDNQTVAYSKDQFDITDQVLEYSNNTYEGKK